MDNSSALSALCADTNQTPCRPAPILWQHTVARPVSCVGVGVHSGAPATLTLKPAPIGSGIHFIRTDLPEGQNRIPALYHQVSDTRLCSALSNGLGASVSTVEHLMAALAGCGVHNADILIDGPEVPIMDGSSAPFVLLIAQAGLMTQVAAQKQIKVLRAVRVEDGNKWAAYTPANEASYSMDIAFASAAIGQQTRTFTLHGNAFAQDLARARTFGFLHEVEQLRAMGLAKGGSLDNAVVIDGDTILNQDGLRYEDEFVRHKLLDSVGDLALAGAPIIGAFASARGGHAMNNKLLHALFADPQNWTWA